MKLHDLNHAARTAILHSQNCVVIRSNVEDWPVMLSFPSTPSKTRWCLHIPANDCMWTVNIILESTLWDSEFLCTLYYGIHQLLGFGVSTNSPIPCNMPMKDLRPLNDVSIVSPDQIAVFQRGDRVFKYYDNQSIDWKFRKPNIELLKRCTKITKCETGLHHHRQKNSMP